MDRGAGRTYGGCRTHECMTVVKGRFQTREATRRQRRLAEPSWHERELVRITDVALQVEGKRRRRLSILYPTRTRMCSVLDCMRQAEAERAGNKRRVSR